MSKLDTSVYKRPAVLEGRLTRKLGHLKVLKTLSAEERLNFLARAEYFNPVQATWRSITDYVLGAWLPTQFPENSWLLERTFTSGFTSTEDLLCESILTPVEGPLRDKQCTFKATPAITKFGTEHPFVWQVSYVPRGTEPQLAGLMFQHAPGHLDFAPAEVLSTQQGEGLVAALEHESVWSVIDRAVLRKVGPKISLLFQACAEAEAANTEQRLQELIIASLKLDKLQPWQPGNYPVKIGNLLVSTADKTGVLTNLLRVPTLQRGHARLEIQEVFLAAFNSLEGAGQEGVEMPPITFGKFPTRFVGNLHWALPNVAASRRAPRFARTSRVEAKKSQCWLCNRHLQHEHAVLGSSCKRRLKMLVGGITDAELRELLMKLLSTDPSAFVDKIQSDHIDLKEARENAMAEAGESESDSDEDVDSDDVSSDEESLETSAEEKTSDSDGEFDSEDLCQSTTTEGEISSSEPDSSRDE